MPGLRKHTFSDDDCFTDGDDDAHNKVNESKVTHTSVESGVNRYNVEEIKRPSSGIDILPTTSL